MVFGKMFTSGRSLPARITRAKKDFAIKLNFKDMKFPVKIRDLHKIEKRILLSLVF